MSSPTRGEELQPSEENVSPAKGARLVTAVLANGRTVRLRVRDSFATAEALDAIVEAVNRTSARQTAHNRRLQQSLARLSSAVANQSARATQAWNETLRTLESKARAGDRKLDAGVQKQLTASAMALDTEFRGLDRMLRRTHRRALWDALVLAGMLPATAAYGRPGDPLHAHNITLGATAGVWVAGDELVDLLSGDLRHQASKVLDSDLWSYSAPLGTALTAWWLLRERQHERFLTGIVDGFAVTPIVPARLVTSAEASVRTGFREAYYAHIELGDKVATRYDLTRLTDAPALATIVKASPGPAVADGAMPQLAVQARIIGHELVLQVVATLGRAEVDPSADLEDRTLGRMLNGLSVAWMVDLFGTEGKEQTT